MPPSAGSPSPALQLFEFRDQPTHQILESLYFSYRRKAVEGKQYPQQALTIIGPYEKQDVVAIVKNHAIMKIAILKNAIMGTVPDWSKPTVFMVRRSVFAWSVRGLHISCEVAL